MKNTKRLLGTVLLLLSLGGCSEKNEITTEEEVQKEETSVLSVPTPAPEEKEIQTADTAENQETPSSEEKPKETAKTKEKKKKKTETAAQCHLVKDVIAARKG